MICSCIICFRQLNACVCVIINLSFHIVQHLIPDLNACQTLNEIPRVHQNIHFCLISPVWTINQANSVNPAAEWKTLHYSECQTSSHLIVSSNDISDMCDDSSNVAHDEWKIKDSRRMIVLSLSNCEVSWYCTVLSGSNLRLIVSSNSRHYKKCYSKITV